MFRNFLSVKTIFLLVFINDCFSKSIWKWECVNNHCEKTEITDENLVALSLDECRITCYDHGSIWPLPTGSISLSKELIAINPNSIEITGIEPVQTIYNLSKSMEKIFIDNIQNQNIELNDSGLKLSINLEVADDSSTAITIDTDEAYSIIGTSNLLDEVTVIIQGETIFGVRHGLETLGQLIVSDLNNQLKMPRIITITDKPMFPHRGVLLDTSRNFFSVEIIKKILQGMGATKLNTFHWHITDTASFPYYSKSLPELSEYGAYSSRKIYSLEDVEELVQFALERGVKIIPEFDAPSHVGQGWQNTDFVACMAQEPWLNYCVEPPCGQFDPTKPKLYDALEKLYGDLLESFNPDMFHMGGDEVFLGCWNSTESITKWMHDEQGWGTSKDDFLKLWNYFQTKALDKLRKVAGRNITAILWTSDLTSQEYLSYLSNKDYVIHVWTAADDPSTKAILDSGFKIIISNYDILYLDCGFASWVSDGVNWCAPYKGWQEVYNNNFANIAGDKIDQVLGSEAALWSESSDEFTVESKIFPRSSAMAERLWTNPNTGWQHAEQRMLFHRERLVKLGIRADALQPEWCMQNDNKCPASPIEKF